MTPTLRSWPLLLAGILAAVAGLASPAFADLMRGSGLAFPAAPPTVGQSLELVGHFEASTSDPPFEMSPLAEYTWTLYGSVVHLVEKPSAGIRYLHLTFGVFEIRRDASFNSAYAPNPPNGLVPSTFHDGEIVLLGTVTDFRIREIFGVHTAFGDVQFVEGAALAELEGPADWTLSAAISFSSEDVPEGYGGGWDIELLPRKPVDITEATWSGIKSLYR